MTAPREGSSEAAPGVLRAVGSLLVALSGGDDATAQHILGNLQESQAPPSPDASRDAPREVPGGAPRSAYAPPAARTGDDVEFVLSDARQRAQRILDDSMERARELIRRERYAIGGIDPGAFDDVRRAVYGLVTEVRDIQSRLARIESLLTAPRRQPQRPAPRPQPQASETPSYEAPQYEAPQYEPPSYEAPPYEASQYEAPPLDTTYEPPLYQRPPAAEGAPQPAYQAPTFEVPAFEPPPRPEPESQPAPPPVERAPAVEAPAEPYGYQRPGGETAEAAPPAFEGGPAPAPAPPRAFSVVPPERRDWPSTEEPAPGAAGWEAPSDASQAPLATFLPGGGGIVLRVTPVAGFQGLMRVQDALARMPFVRQAAVEAYSQGEARLRLELAEATDSEELAAGLGRALHEPAQVREASEADRQLLIALR